MKTLIIFPPQVLSVAAPAIDKVEGLGPAIFVRALPRALPVTTRHSAQEAQSKAKISTEMHRVFCNLHLLLVLYQQHTASKLNLFLPPPPMQCYIIIGQGLVNPTSLRPYHTTLGPAASPACSKILAPPRGIM